MKTFEITTAIMEFFKENEEGYITDKNGNKTHSAFNPNRVFFRYRI